MAADKPDVSNFHGEYAETVVVLKVCAIILFGVPRYTQRRYMPNVGQHVTQKTHNS